MGKLDKAVSLEQRQFVQNLMGVLDIIMDLKTDTQSPTGEHTVHNSS